MRMELTAMFEFSLRAFGSIKLIANNREFNSDDPKNLQVELN